MSAITMRNALIIDGNHRNLERNELLIQSGGMMENVYRCAAVYNSKQILVFRENRYFRAELKTKVDKQILVGDYVKCEYVYDTLVVKNIMHRRNMIQRIVNGKRQGLAANIDVVFIVTSANRDFNIARLERYYIIAKENGIPVCFVLSKVDLDSDYETLVDMLKSRFESPVVATSIYSSDSHIALQDYWKENETAIFLGSSGVGKSSLINKLMNTESIKTQAIREKDDRGHHTTTIRHMYLLDDNRFIIDTPGLRSIGVSKDDSTIDSLFPEIVRISKLCRFTDCTHTNEPGCAIQAALADHEIDYLRYMRYLRLTGEEQKRELLLKGASYEKRQYIRDLRMNEINKRKRIK